MLNGKPLGWLTDQTKERSKELSNEVGGRNCVDAKLGHAKRWYGIGNIHPKFQITSESYRSYSCFTQPNKVG